MAANVDLNCHLSFIAVVYWQESQQLVDGYEGYTRYKYKHGTMFWSICVHFPWGLTTTVHVNVGLSSSVVPTRPCLISCRFCPGVHF